MLTLHFMPGLRADISHYICAQRMPPFCLQARGPIAAGIFPDSSPRQNTSADCLLPLDFAFLAGSLAFGMPSIIFLTISIFHNTLLRTNAHASVLASGDAAAYLALSPQSLSADTQVAEHLCHDYLILLAAHYIFTYIVSLKMLTDFGNAFFEYLAGHRLTLQHRPPQAQWYFNFHAIDIYHESKPPLIAIKGNAFWHGRIQFHFHFLCVI